MLEEPSQSSQVPENFPENTPEKLVYKEFVLWDFVNEFKNSLNGDYTITSRDKYFRIYSKDDLYLTINSESDWEKSKELQCFIKPEMVDSFESFLKEKGFEYKKEKWITDSLLYKVNIISFSDLETPNLEKNTGERKIYNSNNVLLERGDMDFNRSILYLYYYGEQLARIEVDDQNNVKKIFWGGKLSDKKILNLVITTNPDIPYKEHLKRFFNINEDDSSVKELEENYKNESARVKEVLEQYETIEKLPGWKTTDPNHHDPSNFRYFVHTVNPISITQQLQKAALREDEFNENDSNLNIDVLEEPEKFVQRKFVSTSIIDQAHYALYANYGVILGVPEDNIIQADSETMVTVHSDQSKYEKQESSAQKILENTHFKYYNEVVINGKNPKTGEQIQIIGGIIVTDPFTKKPINQEGALSIERFCSRENIPLVYISKPIS